MPSDHIVFKQFVVTTHGGNFNLLYEQGTPLKSNLHILIISQWSLLLGSDHIQPYRIGPQSPICTQASAWRPLLPKAITNNFLTSTSWSGLGNVATIKLPPKSLSRENTRNVVAEILQLLHFLDAPQTSLPCYFQPRKEQCSQRSSAPSARLRTLVIDCLWPVAALQPG